MHSFNAYNMYKKGVTVPFNTLLTDDEFKYITKAYKENLN